jgi:OmpA-OmpF porin, OOP family
MQFKPSLGRLGVAVLAALATPLALAADLGPYPGPYVGGNVGVSKSHFDEARIAGAIAPGFGITGINDDDRDIGWKLYMGYQFNRNFAAEFGYFDLGKFGFTATTVPAGTLSGNLKPRGANLDIIGMLPLTDRFSAFARAGIIYAQTKSEFNGTGAVFFPTPSRGGDSDVSYKYGLGLEYALTPALAFRAEAERYRVPDTLTRKDNVDLFSIGIVYRWGRPPAPVYQPAAYTPPPQPVVAPPPPPPPPKPKPEAKPEAVAPPPPPPPEVVTPAPARKPAPARRDRY